MLLNLLLVGGLAAVGWQAREELRRSQADRKAHLNVPVKAAVVPPPPVFPKPVAPAAIQFEDVAKKNLFAKDRSPDIVVEPPKPVEVKKMPALPVVYGVMAMPSGVRAIMAANKGEPGHGTRVGDKLGEFEIAALESERITVLWNGGKVERRIEDLIDRSGPPHQGGGGGAAPGPRGPAAPPLPPPPSNAPPKMGDVTGEGTRACAAGDNSPAGPVLDGYRKTVVQTPFGPMGCRWQK